MTILPFRFQFGHLLFTFLVLLPWLRLNTMLYKSCEWKKKKVVSGHHCLIPDSSGKAFSFSLLNILSIMLASG